MCYNLCKPQKIVLDGKEIILRNPRMNDVKTLLEFINSLVEEDAPILVNKKATLKEEKEWLKDRIKLVKKNKLHGIFVFHKNEAIGNAEVRKGNWRQSHVGNIGVSVKKNYRGIGLGKLLMKKAIEVAKKDPEIKVLTLSVYPVNKIAMNLYKKLGFKVVATLHKRHLYKGKYVDEYVMDYPIKK